MKSAQQDRDLAGLWDSRLRGGEDGSGVVAHTLYLQATCRYLGRKQHVSCSRYSPD
jgi:hypothetical protein